MTEAVRGTITISIGDEHAATDLGSGWTEQSCQTRIQPAELAEDPNVLQYAAEAAGLLASLFASRLQRPGFVRRMVVRLEVER